MHVEIRDWWQLSAPLRFRSVDHVNVPGVASPSKDLAVPHTGKIVSIPEFVRRGVRDDAGCVGNIFLVPASARHPQHVERNGFALIDFDDFL